MHSSDHKVLRNKEWKLWHRIPGILPHAKPNSKSWLPLQSVGTERSMKSIELLINTAVHLNDERGSEVQQKSCWISTDKTTYEFVFSLIKGSILFLQTINQDQDR